MTREAAEEHYQRGVGFSQNAMISAAIEEYLAAAASDPTWALPHLNLGVAFLDKGDAARAVLELRDGLSLSESKEEKAVFLSNMGQAYYQLGDLELAIDSYKQSIEHQESPTTWVELGVAWHSIGQNDKAVACLERYLQNPVEELYPTSQIRALLQSYRGIAPRGGCAAIVILVCALAVGLLGMIVHLAVERAAWI